MMETPGNKLLVWRGPKDAWAHSRTLPNMWVGARDNTTTVRCLGYGEFETCHHTFKTAISGCLGAWHEEGRGCARIQWTWQARGGPGASNKTLHHQWNLLVAPLCTKNTRLT